MKKKIRKDNLFFLAIGIIIAGSISVTAATYFPSNDVTYDNTKSGLQSTNVQGAIDELYNTCSSAISSGKYMYYAVNSYTVYTNSSSSVNRFETHDGSTLYRANLDGTNATVIYNNSGRQSIDDIYVAGDYIYYAVNSHDIYTPSSSSVNRFETHGGSTLYRANLDGTNATVIYNNSGRQSIDDIIYVAGDYIYYAANSYAIYNSTSAVQYERHTSSTLYRANLDGTNATEISSNTGGIGG